jgi:hypothetical protein
MSALPQVEGYRSDYYWTTAQGADAAVSLQVLCEDHQLQELSLQKPSSLLLSRMPSYTNPWPRSVGLRCRMPNTLLLPWAGRCLGGYDRGSGNPLPVYAALPGTLGCSGGQVCRQRGASVERPALLSR